MSKAGKPGRGEKAQAIRNALTTHGHLKNKELVEYLAAKGFKCTTQDIANQKARIKRLESKRSFSLSDLLKVKAVIAEAGGIKAVQSKLADVENLARQAGGLDKLRRGLDMLPQLSN